jgi:hypothetical protein
VKLDTTYGHPLFFELIQKMAELHANKNRDYGNGNPLGNFMTAEDLGVDPFLGVLIRMSDKWTRICSLTKQGQHHVKDESIEDTLLDLANYSLLALVIKNAVEEKKGKYADMILDDVEIGPVLHEHVSTSTLVADPKCYVLPSEDVITKSFTCLTCTMFATELNTGGQCDHCIFNGQEKPGVIDYYIDQRIVASMTKDMNTQLVDCVAPNAFCACSDCRQGRSG